MKRNERTLSPVIDQADLTWIAGLFEGEGSLRWGPRKRGIIFQIKMNDEDVLRRVQTITGLGHVYGPYKRPNPKHSDYWVWQLARQPDVWRMLLAIYPELGERRQAQWAGYILSEQPVQRTPARSGVEEVCPGSGALLPDLHVR